ncbi:MAG TPA: SUMF1/EgtB/PvdO family nonheme iron enzyme [Nitrospirales bacterium]|nr:SUMF1/EgtB/PvdO family nonheme iron enzyme [Nitrospirales bacterium]
MPTALARARRSMDATFALVPPGRWLARPVPERHRLLFYVGHVEAFDWNLVRTTLDLRSHHPSFDQLFAFGIDPKSGRLPDDAPSDWPSLDEISEYTAAARRNVDAVLRDVPSDLLHIAIEHRLMHVETFTYLLHNLPEPVGPQPPAAAPFRARIAEDAAVEIPAGTATLGRRSSDDDFAWDNEFDTHSVFVPEFRIDRYKVSNRRYLQFVEAGAPPPHFWRRRDGAWYWRALGGEIPMPWDWPVYVTHHEASAYAAWAGKALPTEAEFHRAAYGTPDGRERAYPWGDSAPTPVRGNFDGRRPTPIGIASTPLGDSAFGVAQLVGNGWEWTATVFAPFEGFQPHAAYPGYSAAFFDGDHYVLKGGSPVTPARLLRRSFRNWFRPTYPYVYAAFRCVER